MRKKGTGVFIDTGNKSFTAYGTNAVDFRSVKSVTIGNNVDLRRINGKTVSVDAGGKDVIFQSNGVADFSNVNSITVGRDVDLRIKGNNNNVSVNWR